MSLLNIFKKKPEQVQSSQPVQGSGYGSNYASNSSNYQTQAQAPKPVQASNYSTQNYLGNMLKQPTVTPRQTYSQPQSQAQPAKVNVPQTLPWGTNKASMPWGLSSQPSFSGVKQQPQMSVAPKQNMSVAPTAPKPLMSVETDMSRFKRTDPIQQKTMDMPASNPNTDWMKYVTDAAGRQKSFAEQQRDDNMNFLKAQGELTNQQLLGQLPINEQNFNQYKTNTEASIADLLAGGDIQKSQTSDYYGDAQRQAAQTLRETQSQDQKMFANLGTLDSRGEGSFAQANENTTSDFNRYTQQNLKAKADQLSQIDMTVNSAVRDAKATIYQEEQKMRQLERDIQYAVANNDLTTAQGLKEAYATSQQYIYDIQDSVAQTQYQFGLEQQKLENELATMQSFTPEFMASGQPTNQAEYEFFIKNQPNIKSAYGIGASGGKQTEKQMAYNAAGNIAQNALSKLNSGQVSTGIGNKFLGSIGEKLGTNSPEQQAYRSDIAAMRTSIQNALLGANMSPKEMEQIMAAIPQYNDDMGIARSKLQSLITNLPIMAGNGQQVANQLDDTQLNQILASLGN